MALRRKLAVAAGVTSATALALAGAFVGGSVAQISRSGAGSGSATFSDPAGDANGAPDVTAIVVSDDPASGVVQFTATVEGMAAINPALSPEVNVFIDTDRNSATGSPAGREFTGSPAGAECRLSYEPGEGFFESWDASSWHDLALSPTMSFSESGVTLIWRLGKTDLGAASGFKFYVGNEIFDNHQTIGLDRAPGDGVWSYDYSPLTPPTTTTPAAAVEPLIGAPTTTPGKGVGGKRFAVSFPVTRSDTGAPLTSGTMICDPSIRGKIIPHAESFRNGTARLAMKIPKNAKGKLLRVKVTIRLGDESATRIATYRVR